MINQPFWESSDLWKAPFLAVLPEHHPNVPPPVRIFQESCPDPATWPAGEGGAIRKDQFEKRRWVVTNSCTTKRIVETLKMMG